MHLPQTDMEGDEQVEVAKFSITEWDTGNVIFRDEPGRVKDHSSLPATVLQDKHSVAVPRKAGKDTE